MKYADVMRVIYRFIVVAYHIMAYIFHSARYTPQIRYYTTYNFMGVLASKILFTLYLLKIRPDTLHTGKNIIHFTPNRRIRP